MFYTCPGTQVNPHLQVVTALSSHPGRGPPLECEAAGRSRDFDRTNSFARASSRCRGDYSPRVSMTRCATSISRVLLSWDSVRSISKAFTSSTP